MLLRSVGTATIRSPLSGQKEGHALAEQHRPRDSQGVWLAAFAGSWVPLSGEGTEGHGPLSLLPSSASPWAQGGGLKCLGHSWAVGSLQWAGYRLHGHCAVGLQVPR